MSDTKEKILNSTLKLFSEKGIDQTSLKDIANDANISKGTLFYHYPSKNELLYNILAICSKELTDILRNSIKGHLNKDSQFAMESIFKKIIANNFIMKINFLLAEKALSGDTVILEKLREEYQTWREEYYEVFASSQPKLTKEQIDAKITILLATIDGICLQYFLDPTAINLRDISEQLVKMLSQEPL